MSSLIDCTRRLARTFPLLALLALGGCAEALPDRLREARTGAYVFHHPATDVESAARALLVDEGFEMVPVSADGVLRTTWRAILDDEQFATTYERYFIVIKRLTPEHCRIAAIKMSASSLGMETEHPHNLSKNEGSERNGNNTTYGKGKAALQMGPVVVNRDLGFEWKLISREEPARAQLVQADIAWQVAHR